MLPYFAGVVELVYTADLKSAANRLTGSSPVAGTIQQFVAVRISLPNPVKPGVYGAFAYVVVRAGSLKTDRM